MKKLIINIVALGGLIISVAYAGCSVHQHKKHIRNYSNDRYHHNGHSSYDNGRDHRYAPPRQY